MPDEHTGDPVELVRRYLRLVEDRDLPRAAELLGPDVTITFPGGRTFTSLAEQVASSGGRFQSVTKSFSHFDVAADGDQTVVYAFGTLEGTALDGASFDSVRFIDRFVLRDGRIIDQKVWNDLAEDGVLRPTQDAPGAT